MKTIFSFLALATVIAITFISCQGNTEQAAPPPPAPAPTTSAVTEITEPSVAHEVLQSASLNNGVAVEADIAGTDEAGMDEASMDNEISAADFPAGITVIESGAYSDSGLSGNLIIPDTVTTISDAAFSNNKLTSVIIPPSVTFIGNHAFSNNQLTSIVIPIDVDYIGIAAFQGNNLTSIIFEGSSVLYVREDVFGSDFYYAYSGAGSYEINSLGRWQNMTAPDGFLEHELIQ